LRSCINAYARSSVKPAAEKSPSNANASRIASRRMSAKLVIDEGVLALVMAAQPCPRLLFFGSTGPEHRSAEASAVPHALLKVRRGVRDTSMDALECRGSLGALVAGEDLLAANDDRGFS
jgi:hypothetical protein